MKKGHIIALLVALGLAVTGTPAAATEKNDKNAVSYKGSSVTVAEVISCSGADQTNALDGDSDTFWTSKDKHTPDNRHFFECVFAQPYELDSITLTLGRLSNNKWGFIPENIRVEILSDGIYTITSDQVNTSEILTINIPDGMTADGIRLSYLDQKSKGFSIREIVFTQISSEDDEKTEYTQKKVYADYHGPRYTREHDGNLGNWSYSGEAKNTATQQHRAVRNADLIMEDGTRQLAADAYPMVGMQSQMDQDYQEYQILLAKMANIDGFFIEWGFPGHGTDVQLELMMETAEKYDFELGINWCDAWHMKDWITNIKPDVVTREEKVQEAVNSLSEILDKLYASSVGALYDGHPVVYLFGGGFEKPELKKIIKEAELPQKFQENTPWYFRRASVSGNVDISGKVNYTYAGNSWHDTINGPFGWVPERVRNAQKDGMAEFDLYGTKEDALAYMETLKQALIADKNIPLRNSVVSPGMDNRSCAGWGDKYKFLDREDGDLYKELWEYNVENREYLDVVYIASWNDYTEGHQIEPTVEDGYRELLTTQKYAYQFKGEGNQESSEFHLPAELFSLRKEAERLKAIGFVVEKQQAKLDRVGMAIASGDYVQANTIIEEISTELARLEQEIYSESIICGSEEFTMEQGERLNVAYDQPVTTNAAEDNIELVVDGISKTIWHYEGEAPYLEIDLGKSVNLVSGEVITDSPFTLWYWKDNELLPAQVTMKEERSDMATCTFSILPSITTDKVRLVFSKAAGSVAEVKLFENKVPQIQLIRPENGAQMDFAGPWEICLSIHDIDSDVSAIEVYIDDELVVPSEQNKQGETYVLIMEPIAEAIHKLWIKAIDQEGGESVTNSVLLYPPLENVALSKPVTANVYLQNFGPEKAVDGIISLDSRWRTPSDVSEHWLEIDLQGTYEICRADLYMGDNTGFAIQDFQLEYWAEDQWNTIPGTAFTENKIKDLSLSFNPISTSKVRFYSNEAVGRGIRLKELEIYAPAAHLRQPFGAGEFNLPYADKDIKIWNTRNKCFLTLNNQVLEQLQDGYVEGKFTFTYMDDGYDIITLLAASNDLAEFGDFRKVAEIHRTNTGEWVSATVAFTNDHIVINHEAENDSDFVFAGESAIKDVSIEFTVSSRRN